ncbi:MAG: hypothetical protein EOO53_05495 [Gammaproteobacteria bacterium]|nr:MAG: hypothetical protein EOO53_05495 [Gammaproteobacteria bacterium]
MAAIIYTLCTLTSLLCALLLLRSYFRSKYRLLYWAGICFLGITLNNMLLVADKLIFPNIDLFPFRVAVGFLALCFFMYGLIFDE